MSRYIDAEALTDEMLEHYNDLCEKHGDYDHYTTGYGDAIDKIENAPTADVVEVRHGKWETVCNATTTGSLNCYMHSCSACCYSYKTVAPIGYEYCPKCGAKMDGERRENGT